MVFVSKPADNAHRDSRLPFDFDPATGTQALIYSEILLTISLCIRRSKPHVANGMNATENATEVVRQGQRSKYATAGTIKM